MQPSHVIILTGMAGAGKSTAVHALEDQGYWCVDNLPAPLFPKLLDLAEAAGGQVARLAVVCDARDPALPLGFEQMLLDVQKPDLQLDLVFLEASDDVLRARFSRTGRRHPLMGGDEGVDQSIARERSLLAPLRARASHIIDTSALTVHQLRRLVTDLLGFGSPTSVEIAVLSFAYTRGVPAEVDLALDARFLPDVRQHQSLANEIGSDEKVQDWLLESPAAKQGVAHFVELVADLFPRYQREGKAYLTIGIGCGDGQRRAPALARIVKQRLTTLGFEIHLRDRDMHVAKS